MYHLDITKAKKHYESDTIKGNIIFAAGELLGKGSYGFVHRCKFPHRKLVLKHGSKSKPNKIELEFCKKVCKNNNNSNNLKEFQDYMPKIYGLYETKNKIYILMEYVQGGDLGSKYFIDYFRNHSNKFELLVKITEQSAKALSILHKNEYIHNDIKPENIIIDDKEQIKIIDFGFTSRQITSKSYIGSPLFLAPDVIESNEINRKKDMWALGLTIYNIVVGEDQMLIENIMSLNNNILKFEFDKLYFTLEKMQFIFENALHQIEKNCCAMEFTDIIFGCLDDQVRFRFTSADVIKKINTLKKKKIQKKILKSKRIKKINMIRKKKNTIRYNPKIGLIYS